MVSIRRSVRTVLASLAATSHAGEGPLEFPGSIQVRNHADSSVVTLSSLTESGKPTLLYFPTDNCPITEGNMQALSAKADANTGMTFIAVLRFLSTATKEYACGTRNAPYCSADGGTALNEVATYLPANSSVKLVQDINTEDQAGVDCSMFAAPSCGSNNCGGVWNQFGSTGAIASAWPLKEQVVIYSAGGIRAAYIAAIQQTPPAKDLKAWPSTFTALDTALTTVTSGGAVSPTPAPCTTHPYADGTVTGEYDASTGKYCTEAFAQAACNCDTDCQGYWVRNSGQVYTLKTASVNRDWAAGQVNAAPNPSVQSVKVKGQAGGPTPTPPTPSPGGSTPAPPTPSPGGPTPTPPTPTPPQSTNQANSTSNNQTNPTPSTPAPATPAPAPPGVASSAQDVFPGCALAMTAASGIVAAVV